MALTSAQLAALKADIESNADTLQGKTPLQWWQEGNHGMVAAFYAQMPAADFYVWRTSVPFSEIMDNLVAADWTAMDNLTVGQDRIWSNLKETGAFKAASTAHRAAIGECWKGTQAKLDVGTRILGLGKRKANNVEKLLATGGAGSLVDPSTMGFEGTLSWDQVVAAMAS